MAFIYLSFASDQEFLGACVVEASDVQSALRRATELRINPGGEVMALVVPRGKERHFPTNVLLSREDMEAIDGAPGRKLREMTDAQRQDVNRNTIGVVCENCNEGNYKG